MRDAWVEAFGSGDLTQLRYIDWLITVPLQIVEFYLILKVVGKVTINLFWQLLIASIVMLVGGLLGEMDVIDATIGFIIGMIGWLYVVYLIFVGGAAKASAEGKNENVQAAFNSMKLIVLVGWAIYPLGYIIGNMVDVTDGVQTVSYTHLTLPTICSV